LEVGVQVSNVLPQLVAMDGVCVPIVRGGMQLLMLVFEAVVRTRPTIADMSQAAASPQHEIGAA